MEKKIEQHFQAADSGSTDDRAICKEPRMKMAILGAGQIAHKMAATITKMETVEAYAVAARDEKRAQDFRAQYGFTKAYGSYEEMLSDEEVDLVYIATPHSHHYAHIKMCLEHHKHVLCEKSFTVNARQAREVLKMAEERGLLLTEAIWTRYMPSRKMLNDIIDSGVIGTVTSLTGNLGYALGNVTRMVEPSLAGGALLDVGVYMVNFAMMVFGNKISKVASSAVMSKKGVDYTDSITMIFENGEMAVMHSSMLGALNRRANIFGDKGYIEITNANNIEKIKVFDENYKELAAYTPPEQITGYEYEVEACRRAIKAGNTQCSEMPHEETIRVLEIMDEMRRSWGYEIPGENL